jgi:hypothetical protein
MTSTSPLEITITLVHPELNDFDLEQLTQEFYQRLANIPDLVAIERVQNETPGAGKKGGHYLVGRLRAKAAAAGILKIAKVTHDALVYGGCATITSSDADNPTSVSTHEFTQSEFIAQVNRTIIDPHHD